MKQIRVTTGLPYIVYYPNWVTDLEVCIKNLHVNLFMHGLGARGTDLQELEDDAELPRALKEPQREENEIWVCPQIPNGDWEDWTVQSMDILINDFGGALSYHVTGLSLGGFGCYAIVERYPYFFTTCAVLCGDDRHGRNIPINSITQIRAWHGVGDTVVNFAGGKASIERLNERGYKQEATFVPVGGKHNIWKETYKKDGLYFTWKQERKTEATGQEVEPPIELPVEPPIELPVEPPANGSIINEVIGNVKECTLSSPVQHFTESCNLDIQESIFARLQIGDEEGITASIEVIKEGIVIDSIVKAMDPWGKLKLSTDKITDGCTVKFIVMFLA